MSRPSRSFVTPCVVAVLMVAVGFVWPDSSAVEPHAPLPAPPPTVERAEPLVRVWVAEGGRLMPNGKRARPKRVYHYFDDCGQINRRGGFTGVECGESQLDPTIYRPCKNCQARLTRLARLARSSAD